MTFTFFNPGAAVIAGDSKTMTGILNVSAYTQTSSGNLNIQISKSPGSTCPTGAGTSYSQLAIANGVSLGGTRTINLLHHPMLNHGDCLQIVTGQTTGQFATVKVMGGGTQGFNVLYATTGVQLQVP